MAARESLFTKVSWTNSSLIRLTRKFVCLQTEPRLYKDFDDKTTSNKVIN